MATAPSIALVLERRATVSSQELITAEDLQELVTEALTEHNSTLTFATLPAVQESLVLLLAWIKLCYVRAARAAQDTNLSGAGGFAQNRDTPYYKNIDLAKALRNQYETLCKQLGIDPAPEAPSVSVSSLRVLGGFAPGVTPLSEGAVPPAPVLTAGAIASGELILSWTFSDFDDFNAFYLFHAASADTMRAAWASHLETGVPGVLETANLIGRTINRDATSTKVTGVEASEPNRFLLVVQSASGKYSYSNEIYIAATP